MPPDVCWQPRSPLTSGRDPPAPEMAAYEALLPEISDVAFMVPRREDRGKPARRMSAPNSFLARSRQRTADLRAPKPKIMIYSNTFKII